MTRVASSDGEATLETEKTRSIIWDGVTYTPPRPGQPAKEGREKTCFAWADHRRSRPEMRIALSSAHGAILHLKCLAEQRCVTDGPGKSHPGSRSKICDDICFALVDEADNLAVSNGKMKSDAVADTKVSLASALECSHTAEFPAFVVPFKVNCIVIGSVDNASQVIFSENPESVPLAHLGFSPCLLLARLDVSFRCERAALFFGSAFYLVEAATFLFGGALLGCSGFFGSDSSSLGSIGIISI